MDDAIDPPTRAAGVQITVVLLVTLSTIVYNFRKGGRRCNAQETDTNCAKIVTRVFQPRWKLEIRFPKYRAYFQRRALFKNARHQMQIIQTVRNKCFSRSGVPKVLVSVNAEANDKNGRK